MEIQSAEHFVHLISTVHTISTSLLNASPNVEGDKKLVVTRDIFFSHVKDPDKTLHDEVGEIMYDHWKERFLNQRIAQKNVKIFPPEWKDFSKVELSMEIDRLLKKCKPSIIYKTSKNANESDSDSESDETLSRQSIAHKEMIVLHSINHLSILTLCRPIYTALLNNISENSSNIFETFISHITAEMTRIDTSRCYETLWCCLSNLFYYYNAQQKDIMKLLETGVVNEKKVVNFLCKCANFNLQKLSQKRITNNNHKGTFLSQKERYKLMQYNGRRTVAFALDCLMKIFVKTHKKNSRFDFDSFIRKCEKIVRKPYTIDDFFRFSISYLLCDVTELEHLGSFFRFFRHIMDEFDNDVKDVITKAIDEEMITKLFAFMKYVIKESDELLNVVRDMKKRKRSVLEEVEREKQKQEMNEKVLQERVKKKHKRKKNKKGKRKGGRGKKHNDVNNINENVTIKNNKSKKQKLIYTWDEINKKAKCKMLGDFTCDCLFVFMKVAMRNTDFLMSTKVGMEIIEYVWERVEKHIGIDSDYTDINYLFMEQRDFCLDIIECCLYGVSLDLKVKLYQRFEKDLIKRSINFDFYKSVPTIMKTKLLNIHASVLFAEDVNNFPKEISDNYLVTCGENVEKILNYSLKEMIDILNRRSFEMLPNEMWELLKDVPMITMHIVNIAFLHEEASKYVKHVFFKGGKVSLFHYMVLGVLNFPNGILTNYVMILRNLTTLFPVECVNIMKYRGEKFSHKLFSTLKSEIEESRMSQSDRRVCSLLAVRVTRLFLQKEYNLDESDDKFCLYCAKTEANFKCSRCKMVYYCSAKCQKLDWKEHKRKCVKKK